ncbi:hypothetical protein ABE530_04125 [Brucella sp. TWI559]
MSGYDEVLSSFELREETSFKLVSLKRFEEDGLAAYHANFLFQYWDETLEAYDNFDLSIQVSGADLDTLSVNEIKKIALKRAAIAAQSLCEHITSHA